MGQRVGRLAGRVELIARWWTSATQEARFALLKAAIEGEAPHKATLEEVQYGAYLAEAEAGEIEER